MCLLFIVITEIHVKITHKENIFTVIGDFIKNCFQIIIINVDDGCIHWWMLIDCSSYLIFSIENETSVKTDSSCFGLCICISHFEVDSKYSNWMYSKQPPDLDSVGVSFILLPGTSIFVVRESFLVILLLYMEMKSNSFSRYWKRVLNSLMWSGKDNIFRKIAEKSVSSIFNLVIM